jgi:hypothetical protein
MKIHKSYMTPNFSVKSNQLIYNKCLILTIDMREILNSHRGYSNPRIDGILGRSKPDRSQNRADILKQEECLELQGNAVQ